MQNNIGSTCDLTTDGSRLWDSNRLTKIEKFENLRFFNFSIFRFFKMYDFSEKISFASVVHSSNYVISPTHGVAVVFWF